MARILFFIVFSFSLHLLSLSFGFIHPSVPLKSQQVNVGYVSKSADSFLPVPTAANHSVKEKHQLQQNNYIKNKVIIGQTQRSSQQTVEPITSNPTVPISRSRQISTPVKLAQISTVRHAPVEKLIKVETIQPDIVEVGEFEQPLVASHSEPELPDRLKVTPLQSQALDTDNSKLSVESDSFRYEGSGQREKENGPSAVSGLTGKNNHPPGTQAALPRYAENIPPEYPRVAKLRGWEGEVVFEVLVLKNGQVDKLKMLTSSGSRSLDRAARRALIRWKFWPATSFGVPVDSQVKIPVIFTLDSDSSRL